MATALELRNRVAAAVRRIELKPLVHYAGGGPARATAYEGALKLREAAHLVATLADAIGEPRLAAFTEKDTWSRQDEITELIAQINPILCDWVQYFAVGNSSRCFS